MHVRSIYLMYGSIPVFSFFFFFFCSGWFIHYQIGLLRPAIVLIILFFNFVFYVFNCYFIFEIISSIAKICYHTCNFLKTFYLFIFREREGGRRRGGETLIGCLLHASNLGPGPQPGHVPWLGIKPLTFWFIGQHPIHWATLARALFCINMWTMLETY